MRDLFGWFGDTLSAKGDLKDARAERDRFRTNAIDLERLKRENKRLSDLLELDGALGLKDYAPKTGRVIAHSPTVWYATIRINQGSSDGVRKGQPVINEQALIGNVTAVFSGSAQVMLITDATSNVSAVAGPRSVFGIVKPSSAGQPERPRHGLRPGGRAAGPGRPSSPRAGPSRRRLPSRFPPGLPIGEITRVDNDGRHENPPAPVREPARARVRPDPDAAGGRRR